MTPDRFNKQRRSRVEAAARAILGGFPDDSCVVVIRTHDGYFTAGGHAFGEGLAGVARLAALGAEHIASEVASGHDGTEAANLTADERNALHEANVRASERTRIVALLRARAEDEYAGDGADAGDVLTEIADSLEAKP